MQEELTDFGHNLREEQESNDNKTGRLQKLERDMRDMRVQLEQKIELGLSELIYFPDVEIVCVLLPRK